ncbi:hypothetical protein OG596_26490 [Streptomyces sp. NBC_01102]|uniref:hypothetical protein n=1 Tax=Streptomyces sp. NBC_01102 TaxID=2903749 RepID=UPI00386593D7|nr:hypothetical protein OG596_26490 [Streptomyces sp. NBC_01102]
MTTETPAAVLRAAAELLREAASHATRGPWRTHDTWIDHGGHTATVLTDRPDINDTELVAWLPTMSNAPWDEARNAWRNAGWMALMDPAVGLALADWLDAYGLDWDRCPSDHPGMSLDEHALVVARRILGTSEQAQPATVKCPDFCMCRATEQADAETAPACICGHPKLRHVEDVCLTCLCGDYIAPQDAAEMIDRWRQAALQARATAAQASAQAALSAPERQFLTFALDLAFDEMVSRGGFDDEDHAALEKFRRLAAEAQQPTPAVDQTETADDAAMRFARRLVAIERLCSGRPGYHTVTVKQVLTAMSDANDEPTPAPAEETK